LIRGEPTRVRILFDAKVARYVERVLWHPTQKFRRTGAGLEMTMKVAATVELESWVLGFGEAAVVVAPRALRAKIAGELARGAGRYKE
jgi:predicted DNA-binding transcriptional regulator YafY